MINFHAIVNPVISVLHPNEENVLLYRSMGKQNIRGEIKTVYAPAEMVIAQIQSLSDDKLYHSGATGQNDISRHAYLFSSTATAEKPASIIRPLARTGDMLQFQDGTWWLITACKEDFSRAGWVNASITLEVNPPDFSASGWYQN